MHIFLNNYFKKLKVAIKAICIYIVFTITETFLKFVNKATQFFKALIFVLNISTQIMPINPFCALSQLQTFLRARRPQHKHHSRLHIYIHAQARDPTKSCTANYYYYAQ